MKKIVLLFFVLLFMSVPVMALPSNVDITCTKNMTDGNWVTVSYVSDHNRIRAFGLDITTEVNKITQVVALDANYRIFPGQMTYVSGDINSYGTCYDPCDLGDANVAIEMGSLYTLDSNYSSDPNAGYRTTPPSTSGNLLKFKVESANTWAVDVNVHRGGIVMEDPCETPSIDSPLCTGVFIPTTVYYDWGDAPNTYLTLKAVNGPNHVMAATGPILGTNRDAEADGQPSLNCDLDDNTGVPDDEDGVTALTGVWGNPGAGTVNVAVSQGPGYLNAWVDFNNDGDFADAGEQIFINTAVTPPGGALGFSVPSTALTNIALKSRFRVTSYTLPTGTYYGAATDGEVEDYNTPSMITCPNTVGSATTPNPANNAVDVNLYRDLVWTKGTGARSHNVYFGTANPPPFKQNQTSVTYDTGTNEDSNHVDYYWRIDEVNGCAVSTGTQWKFTTNLDCMVAPPATTTAHWSDWKTYGKPTCWCYQRQCRGDINGKKTGTWVSSADLSLFRSALLVADANFLPPSGSHYPWGICADLNQKKTGTRVSSSDLTILRTYLLAIDANVPPCPNNWDGAGADDFRWWASPP